MYVTLEFCMLYATTTGRKVSTKHSNKPIPKKVVLRYRNYLP